MSSGPHLEQVRKLITPIPGPKSQELIKRRAEAVSASLGMAIPVVVEKAGGGVIVDVDGKLVKEFKPEVADTIKVEQSTWDFLHRSLRMVVTRGTGAGVFSGFPIEISGKTGTAEVFGKNPNGSAKDDTSWFASYGPTNDPQYAVVMMVSQGGFGASTSGLGVRDIYSTLFGVTGNRVDPNKAVFPNGVPTNIAKVDLKIAASKVDLTGVKVGGVKLK